MRSGRPTSVSAKPITWRRWESAASRRRGGGSSDPECASSELDAVEITCTSKARPDCRMTSLITDPRVSSGPSGASARTEHDLGRVLGQRDLHDGPADVGARDLVVAAAELLEERAVLVELTGLRSGEARRPTARARR